MKISVYICALSLILSVQLSAQTYLRYNQAGYRPDRPKSLVIISCDDLSGQSWTLYEDSVEILSGKINESIAGRGDHTSHPYNHVVDFSSLDRAGDYTFRTGNNAASIRIDPHPYAVLITDALRHLRTARSGTETALNHALSHAGDSAATVYEIAGDAESGRWAQSDPKVTLDCKGGWYDAGDFIKFTLTTANTVYYLLQAWEDNPKAFTSVLSTSGLPDVLDEALHGLNYLMKMHPQPDLFVIQVGNYLDHDQKMRLPENDMLDGKRPALCAISPVHMGVTAAALAKGARVFTEIGRQETADSFLQKALSIYDRAIQPDALEVAAYEKDQTNDFYRDNSLDDNMALGAIELFKTTSDTFYLRQAQSFNPRVANWLGWSSYNWSVHSAVTGEYDEDFGSRAQSQIEYFVQRMDPVWGIPMEYTWSSLLGWNAVGAAAGAWNRIHPDSAVYDLHLKMVDYLFGRNNWGVSFLASTRLNNSIRRIYNPVYRLKELFPQGAVALGPGDRRTHSLMENYFGTPPESALDSFHTDEAVFYDWENDFMTSETVTMSQSYAIWLLAQASDFDTQAPADSSNPTLPNDTPGIDSSAALALEECEWYTFADTAGSKAQWIDQATHSVRLEPADGMDRPYTGFGCILPENRRDLSSFDGFTIYGRFEQNAALQIVLSMESITDYDYHGKNKIGRGDQPLTIMFDQLSQSGFGEQIDFDPRQIAQFNIYYYNTLKGADVRVDSIVFIRSDNYTSSVETTPFFQRNHTGRLVRGGRLLRWDGQRATTIKIHDIRGRTLWKKRILPGQSIMMPRLPGFNILVAGSGKGRVIETRVGF